MRTHQHTNDTKTAIGYVRVSTQEQATDGVSLGAQRDRLRLYCKTNGIKLIDIVADEGISGSTLERPGLQTALRMIKRGRANTLLVAKLDRLSRSVRDICMLIDDYFSDERYHLLSVCGMVNTHNAAGRMLLLNLANYNQFEREVISERTRDALQHMMKQGVRLGPAPYGYEFSHNTDGNGRRLLVPLADEQLVLRKIRDMRAEGLKLHQIARLLNEKGVKPRYCARWSLQSVYSLLRVHGLHKARSTGSPLSYDRVRAYRLALSLRQDGARLRTIAEALTRAQLRPKNAQRYTVASVQDLLRGSILYNTNTAQGLGGQCL